MADVPPESLLVDTNGEEHGDPYVTPSSSSSATASTSSSSLAHRDKDEIFARGKEAYDEKRYPEAQELFRDAADQGQKEACMFLGLMYRYGFGVAQDFSIALDWYRQAADAFPDDCQAQIVFLEKRVKQQASQIPPIDIEVTGTRKHQDAGAKPWTEYIVTISAGGNTWEIRKRYRLFENFHKTLEATFGLQITVPLGFPPKKWLGSMDQEFVQKRKQNLQQYLQRLAAKPEIVSSTAFLNFIQYYEHAPKKQ